MFKGKSLYKILPSIISILKLNGMDIDNEFKNLLEFIPKFIAEKQQEYIAQYPELDINLMVSTHENELYLIPVGLEDQNDKINIVKQFEPFNLTQFLANIKVTKVVKVLKNNPDLNFMDAIKQSNN